MTPDQAKDIIALELARALQGYIGGPVNKVAIQKQVLKRLREMRQEKGVTSYLERVFETVAQLVVLNYIGIPEDFNPKSMLRKLSDFEIGEYVEKFIVDGNTNFPSNLFMLEHLRRQGDLLSDWEWERISANDASVTFALKPHPENVKLNLKELP